MTWTISFYNDKVERETLRLPSGILANFLRVTELIEEFGPDLGRPHTASLGEGLFEIRAKRRYREVGLLHGEEQRDDRDLDHRDQEGPQDGEMAKRHMETARRRLQEVQRS